jgi:hypothetical protein
MPPPGAGYGREAKVHRARHGCRVEVRCAALPSPRARCRAAARPAG